jgi:nucleoside 2-deoxyribosyltransferase
MYHVYLAGPIYGLSYDEATDWRNTATHILEDAGVRALSPLRGKEFLREERELHGAYPEYPLSTDQGIVSRDKFDVLRSDVVLVNLRCAERVSIGTMFEIAWAHGKPVVLIMEDGNIHDHPFVRQCAPFIVGSLEEALDLVLIILGV